MLNVNFFLIFVYKLLNSYNTLAKSLIRKSQTKTVKSSYTVIIALIENLLFFLFFCYY